MVPISCYFYDFIIFHRRKAQNNGDGDEEVGVDSIILKIEMEQPKEYYAVISYKNKKKRLYIY